VDAKVTQGLAQETPEERRERCGGGRYGHDGKDSQKSKVGNGSRFLAEGDQRSVWVRRARELIADHISDLGGLHNTSSAERAIVRRAATLGVELEALEGKFSFNNLQGIESSSDDLHLYQRMTNTQRRCFEALGLARRPANMGTIN
jgi:hypothetical protein